MLRLNQCACDSERVLLTLVQTNYVIIQREARSLSMIRPPLSVFKNIIIYEVIPTNDGGKVSELHVGGQSPRPSSQLPASAFF